MITQDICKIPISETEAIEKVAYTSKDAVYDKDKSELTFIVNNAREKAFRLVYEGGKVRTIVEGADNTVTSTLFNIEEFSTEQTSLDRIKKLGLEYIPPLDIIDEKLVGEK